VEVRLPLIVLFEILGGVLRNQNVAGIAAIHHALSNVDSGSGNVRLLVEIGHFVDRTAVNSHANTKFRMIPERVANLNRAKNWRFQVAKDKRAAVTGWQTEELSFGFGSTKLVGSAHDRAQFLNVRALLGGAQFGIADDVDEEDVRDLEAESRFLLVGHIGRQSKRLCRVAPPQSA
jgi:hypothetical protein